MTRERSDRGTFIAEPVWDRLMRMRRIEDDCWVWTGNLRSRGSGGKGEPYGGVRFEGRMWLVHRLAVYLTAGPIPKGAVVDHLCRRTLCFNPAHLRVVSPRENAAGRDRTALLATLERGRAARWAKVA